MPSFDIVRTSQPTDSFRVQSIIGTYNLQQQHVTEHFTGNIELPDKWNIGLIVGRSGSGKTTIAHELFDADIISGFDWTHDNILDDMPKEATVKDIAAMLTAVGFSSPPSWLKRKKKIDQNCASKSSRPNEKNTFGMSLRSITI